MITDLLTWEHALLAAVVLIGAALTNIAMNWFRIQRLKRGVLQDDVNVASAYARLNQELRDQLSKVERRVTELETLRTAPLRLTTDISPYPEPHVIRSEIVVMSAPPTIVNQVEDPPTGRKR